MNILIVIVHYWNPTGGGSHQSLRPNPTPRVQALQQQLLCLRRIGRCQSVLNMKDRAVYRTNDFFRNNISIKIVTDGEHHILNHLSNDFASSYDEVVVKPQSSKMLGFEAHKVLASYVDKDFDFYCYLEDDLLIHDPSFFIKLNSFLKVMGDDKLLLPQRFEFSSTPHPVDRFYIDGALADSDLRPLVPDSGPVSLVTWVDLEIPLEPPLNPHSGCFFLTSSQLSFWMSQSWWQDLDVSFISPLESAATLGVAKTFTLLKPCFTHASWFEIQHYGDSFHSLIMPYDAN